MLFKKSAFKISNELYKRSILYIKCIYLVYKVYAVHVTYTVTVVVQSHLTGKYIYVFSSGQSQGQKVKYSYTTLELSSTLPLPFSWFICFSFSRTQHLTSCALSSVRTLLEYWGMWLDFTGKGLTFLTYPNQITGSGWEVILWRWGLADTMVWRQWTVQCLSGRQVGNGAFKHGRDVEGLKAQTQKHAHFRMHDMQTCTDDQKTTTQTKMHTDHPVSSESSLYVAC